MRRRILSCYTMYAHDQRHRGVFFSLDSVNGFRRDFSLQDKSYVQVHSSQNHSLTSWYKFITPVSYLLVHEFSHHQPASIDMPFMSVYRYVIHPGSASSRLTGIKNWALYMICFIAPLVLQFAISCLTLRSWWDVHNGNVCLQSPETTH